MFDIFFSLGSRAIKNDLIKGSFWVAIGTISSSFLAFLTNLFLARNLSVIDYGIYASLISLLTLATIPSRSISTVIMKFSGSYLAKNDKSNAARFYVKLLSIFGLIAIFILVFLTLFIIPISNFLHIESKIHVLLIVVAVSVTYLSIVNQAYLMSMLKFSFITYVSLIGAVIRLISTIIFVFAGLKITGAFLGVIVSLVSVLLLKFIPLLHLFKIKLTKNSPLPRKDILKYSFPSTVSIFAISLFVSGDVILARHFLPAYEAGLYGGLSLIGKIIVYCVSPISSVAFPIFVQKYEKKQNFKKVLYQAAILVVAPSALIAMFYYLFPELVISIFLSTESYLQIAPLLWVFGLFIAIYSIAHLILNFFLSIKKTNIVYITVFFASTQLVLIYLFHNTILEIVQVSLLAVSMLLASYLAYLYFYIKKELNN